MPLCIFLQLVVHLHLITLMYIELTHRGARQPLHGVLHKHIVKRLLSRIYQYHIIQIVLVAIAIHAISQIQSRSITTVHV